MNNVVPNNVETRRPNNKVRQFEQCASSVWVSRKRGDSDRERILPDKGLLLQSGIPPYNHPRQGSSSNPDRRRTIRADRPGSPSDLLSAARVEWCGNSLEITAPLGRAECFGCERTTIPIQRQDHTSESPDWSQDATTWKRAVKAVKSAILLKVRNAFSRSRVLFGTGFNRECCGSGQTITEVSNFIKFPGQYEAWPGFTYLSGHQDFETPGLEKCQDLTTLVLEDLSRDVERLVQELCWEFTRLQKGLCQVEEAVRIHLQLHPFKCQSPAGPGSREMEGHNRQIQQLRLLRLEAEDIHRRCEAIQQGVYGLSQVQKVLATECLNRLAVVSGWATELECRESIIAFKERILKDYPEFDLAPERGRADGATALPINKHTDASFQEALPSEETSNNVPTNQPSNILTKSAKRRARRKGNRDWRRAARSPEDRERLQGGEVGGARPKDIRATQQSGGQPGQEADKDTPQSGIDWDRFRSKSGKSGSSHGSTSNERLPTNGIPAGYEAEQYGFTDDKEFEEYLLNIQRFNKPREGKREYLRQLYGIPEEAEESLWTE